jgi:hypothetical protein
MAQQYINTDQVVFLVGVDDVKEEEGLSSI